MIVKRTLLVILAVVCASFCNAQILQFSGAPVIGPFQGNPNVTIISISGSITASRTSCQTPCFVQVSASTIIATGTSVPYEDLEYQWNFNDPTGTEIFNQPLDLNLKRYNPQPVNANNSQWGPEAAYIYRLAGTYTVTLSARGKNGSGFTTATITQSITVTTYDYVGNNRDWYFDSAAAGGGNGSISTPYNDLATLNTKVSISNTAIHIKRGSSWSSSTGVFISGVTSNVRIDAYGTGNTPVIDVNSGSASSLSATNGSAGTPTQKSDIVVSNITFSNSGAATSAAVVNVVATGNATATMNNIYFDNCTMTTNVNVASAVVINMNDLNTVHHGTNYGLWNTVITQPLTPNLGNRQGFFGGPQDWFFVVGGSFVGAGSNLVLDHHIYPDVKTHSLYRYINFGSGPGKNYNINTNWDGAGSLEFAEFVLMSDNNFSGTLRGFDASNATNNVSLTQFRNFVAQRSSFQSLTGDGTLQIPCMSSFTLRDDLIWNVDGGRFYAPGAASVLSDRIYRNLAYRTAGQNNGAFYSWVGATFTGGTRTFTDNVTQDTEVTAKPIALVWSDVQAGSIINRDQWYAPSDSDTNYFYDNATAKSFAQWQAGGFDLSLPTGGGPNVANPNWVDPANGNFN